MILRRLCYPSMIFLLTTFFSSSLFGNQTKFKFSFSERIRQESWDNITSLDSSKNDGNSYLRFKSLFRLQINLKQIEIGVQLGNESRIYFNPKKNFKLSETFFDQFYLNWNNFLPDLSLKIGRFDLRFGEGFLFADGTPLDGSRSFYFNGALLSWSISDKSKLHFFSFYQTQQEELLPIISDQNQNLEEQKTFSLGAYLQSKLKKTALEVYLFNKAMLNDKSVINAGTSNLTNIGFRFSAPLMKNLTATSEWALQFGRFQKLNALSFGGYFYLQQKTDFKLPFPQTVTAGMILLSGDNLKTSERHEGWDPAFSRWPKWSDSYIYVLARDTGNAYWTNLFTPYLQFDFNTGQQTGLLFRFYKLWAMEEASPTSYRSGHGRNRGNLYTASFNYVMNKHFKGHLIYEYFQPGNYYIAGAADCKWLRFEMTFSF